MSFAGGLKPLTDAQACALRSIELNGESRESTPQMRALVRKGYVIEIKKFLAPPRFILTTSGRAALIVPRNA